jgi:hypothetical protein
MDRITELSVDKIRSKAMEIKKRIGGDFKRLIKEIEVREGVAFIAYPDRIQLAIGLYINDHDTLGLFGIDGSGSLKDKMVKILRAFIISYEECKDKDAKNSDLRIITINEIFKTLNHLRNIIHLSSWTLRRELLAILKPPNTEIVAKKYGKHGQSPIYHYLMVLEYLLSSFNLATSFMPIAWKRQLEGEAKSTQIKPLRITLPGQLLLDVYANFAVKSIRDSELETYLRTIVSIPKFILDHARDVINKVIEIPLVALTQSIIEELNNTLRIDFSNLFMYTTTILNDVVALLILYEQNRIDFDALIEKGLIRWKI